MPTSESRVIGCRLILRGQVQGIGLRPALARLAQDLDLAGHTRNVSAGVEVYLEGPTSKIDVFRQKISESIPAEAKLTAIDEETREPIRTTRFHILDSVLSGPLTTRVPIDRAMCPACLQEVATAGNRRAQYPFTSCAQCGPRYSLIRSMPYDRCRTSMAQFKMCDDCQAEDSDPRDRRFHAQTIACPDCGPKVSSRLSLDLSGSALANAATVLLSGQILAMRGLGGYQLVVDATNSDAVARLRRRKRRFTKPFAVMVKSEWEASQLAILSHIERELLSGSIRPIVLVPLRFADTLCNEIHPGLREVGLFLPTMPVHWLLLDRIQRPLVVTSGNIEGEPIAVDPSDAEADLRGIADHWLHHDRPILRPIDDSVVRVICDRPVTIRNARGLAPLPLEEIENIAAQSIASGERLPGVLAVGGHQKCAAALFNGVQAVLGPHVGDLDALTARQRFVEHIEQLQQLYICRAAVVVHDQHPDYFTTAWAQASGIKTEAVQHHHAHVVSAMVENQWLDQEVLGVAFDGTGYGDDGTIWGGEFLQATVHGFKRFGHLRPFPLPGNESAIREPWRVAAALLLDAVGNDEAHAELLSLGVPLDRFQPVLNVVRNRQIVPLCTSAGRLFDGAATLILGELDAGFEGHPAMWLESAADPSIEGSYPFVVVESSPIELDWRPMIRHLLSDKRRGASSSMMATKFHRGLASGIAAVCQKINLPIVLTGGVFQNRLLTEWTVADLSKLSASVGLHSRIPPNDGGLAAGQLAIGLSRISRREAGKSNQFLELA